MRCSLLLWVAVVVGSCFGLLVFVVAGCLLLFVVGSSCCSFLRVRVVSCSVL